MSESEDPGNAMLEQLLETLPHRERIQWQREFRVAMRHDASLRQGQNKSWRSMLITYQDRLRHDGSFWQEMFHNDLQLAWVLYADRGPLDQDRLGRMRFEVLTTPPDQLLHTLRLLRKLVQHPDWRIAQPCKPTTEKMAARSAYIAKQIEFGFLESREQPLAEALLQRTLKILGMSR